MQLERDLSKTQVFDYIGIAENHGNYQKGYS